METISSDPAVLTVSHRGRGVFTHNTPWEVSSPAWTGAEYPQGIQSHLDEDSLDCCLPEAPPAKLTMAPGGSGGRGKGQQDPLRTPGQALPSHPWSLHKQVLSCPHPRPPNHLLTSGPLTWLFDDIKNFPSYSSNCKICNFVLTP